jgi:hypothetical protein
MASFGNFRAGELLLGYLLSKKQMDNSQGSATNVGIEVDYEGASKRKSSGSPISAHPIARLRLRARSRELPMPSPST